MNVMRRIIPYIVTLVVMLMLDAIWLSLASQAVYRAQLGDILIPGFRLLPALSFYLVYAFGIQIFAVARARSGKQALGLGAAFGVFAYATYDLTNWATLRDWTFALSLTDICWGAVLTGAGALAGYAAKRVLPKT
ncbi:DUF2177 family protein [Acidocella aquatica]|nr:DUF2177 family protein [Acidocella aquatica]